MNNLKQVNSRPTEGQFIEVWEHNGQIWSDSCKWVNGKLKVFCTYIDGWKSHPYENDTLNKTWFVKTEQITITLETSAELEEVTTVIENYNGEVTDCETIHEDADTTELKITAWFESFNEYTKFIIEFLGDDIAANHIAETVKNQYTKLE